MSKRKPTRTLFDIDYRKHFEKNRRFYPYSFLIKCMENDDYPEFADMEPVIFNDVLDYEIQHYNGWQTPICGPITVKIGRRSVDLTNHTERYCLPMWVESDGLEFTKCSAAGVIVFENHLEGIAASKIWRSLNLIMIAGTGIPRMAVRRVLHRLSTELNLPIYLFAASDVWSYFNFSVLKRGLLGPHASCPFLAVPRIRYLGLRAGDVERCEIARGFVENWRKQGAWKPQWDLRLRALQKYKCFQSTRWKEEFKKFRQQGAQYETHRVCGDLGPDRFCEEFIMKKLQARAWLT